MKHLFEDLYRHNEGGSGASAAPGPADGAEAAGVTAPDAGESKPQATKRNRRDHRLPYEYGSPKNDIQAQAAGKETTSAQTETAERRPYDEIKALYKDEIGQDIATAVTGRVKNLKDSESELKKAQAEIERRDRLLAEFAGAKYNIRPGDDGKLDLDAIEQARKKDRAAEYAMEHGTSEEYAERHLAMEDDLAEKNRQLAEYRMAEEARKQDAATHAMVKRHIQEAEAFRQKIPSFDLQQEIEGNKLFAHLIINCGVGVENAYYAAHHEELMAAGQQAAAMQATQALATRIQAGQSMPLEGGIGRSPAAKQTRITSPKNLTKEMRKDIRERVNRGEKIFWD